MRMGHVHHHSQMLHPLDNPFAERGKAVVLWFFGADISNVVDRIVHEANRTSTHKVFKS